MAEEYENYQEMERLALDAVASWDDTPDDGIATAGDLRALERTLQSIVDELLHKFEELHARVWRFEDRLKELEERLDRLEQPPESRH